MVRFNSIEDLTQEKFLQFEKEMQNIERRVSKSNELINEQSIPKFKTIAEAQQFFGDIPFDEWENKMREKYGL